MEYTLDRLLEEAEDPFGMGADEWAVVVVELVARLKAAEAALDEVSPGWRTSPASAGGEES